MREKGEEGWDGMGWDGGFIVNKFMEYPAHVPRDLASDTVGRGLGPCSYPM